MSKISIVVPIYNVGEKLHCCIQSILNQTFKDWKLLLIDDGCSDNSVSIGRQYEKSDDRIHMYQQHNSGSIAARRRGVELSNSPYIMFVDADDWIHPAIVEKLVGIAEVEDIDITVCNIVKVLRSSRWIRKYNNSYYFEKEQVYAEEEIFNDLIPAFLHGHPFPVQLHGKLYKRELLLTSNHFVSRLHFFGDDLFNNLEMFIQAQKVKIIPDALYYYRLGGYTSRYMPYLFHDVVTGYEIQKEVVLKHYAHDQDYHLFGIRLMLLNSISACLKNLFLSNLSKEERISLIAQYCIHPVVMESVNYEPAAIRCSPHFVRAIREMGYDHLYKLGRKYYLKSVFKKTAMNAISKISF
ncbi:glycosyltransferase family 2 protein [Paenibacillus sp. L3-i20]|uniref:glycosyltransferase family 2 protein n=1 Tax=Paenibacillus sp. L3-i20 TaxID=2905833 RepID=UPI001EE0C452|nr:glycosyltransferase family 2 protein [Paenibacillus sp. L3-i20]